MVRLTSSTVMFLYLALYFLPLLDHVPFESLTLRHRESLHGSRQDTLLRKVRHLTDAIVL